MSKEIKPKSILSKNKEMISKAFHETPMNEFESFMRGIQLGFDLCGSIVRSMGEDVKTHISERKGKLKYEDILNIIKNIKRGGEA